jgi:hypothetical protein
MFGFHSALIACYAVSNLELRRLYEALHYDLVLPSGTNLSIICRRDYALNMDAMLKQSPSRNEVGSPLDAWTSTDKLAIMSVIAYYLDQNWALGELQLAFEEDDCLIYSCFES